MNQPLVNTLVTFEGENIAGIAQLGDSQEAYKWFSQHARQLGKPAPESTCLVNRGQVVTYVVWRRTTESDVFNGAVVMQAGERPARMLVNGHEVK